MNFYAAVALINFITSIILGVFVIYKSRKAKNFSFFIFCSFVAFWSFFYYLWQISTNSEIALFWCRILMAGAIFIPVAYLHFTYALVEILDKRKKFLIFSYFLFSLFLFADATPYFISHVEPLMGFKFWPIAGNIFSLFLVLWFFYVVYSTYLLIKKYKISTGIIRLQIKYVIIGMIIGFIGGSSNYFLWYRIPIPPVANVLDSVYVGAIAYSIVRYRLMDIRVVARKTVIYIFSAGFVYGMFYLIIWFYNKTFGTVFSNGAYLLGLIIAPLFVVLFAWLNNKTKIIANKYLFFSLYNQQETIAKLTDELTNSIDLDKIVDSIINSIKQSMQLDRAGILLISQSDDTINYKIAKVIGFNEHNGISLVQDNFLTQYLERTQKPLVRDEIQLLEKDSNNTEEKQNFGQLSENMKRIEASLCLPMVISNKLIGMIVLGSKVSNDAYTKEDLDLLATLSKQAAIAVDNARLYKEVQDFNKTLRQKVDEQTKDIKKAYEVEKQAHEELKKVDDAKSQFMLITQHHLRTPLTVNMGFLDLLLDNRLGKVPAHIREVISKLQDSTLKEIDVVNDLLNVSQFQLGKEVMKLEQGVDMESLLKEAMKDSSVEAGNKGIYLKLEKSGDVPTIPADKIRLKLALANVIDNAVKYTKQGGVIITLKPENNKLLILVKDTGMGIQKDLIPDLFNQAFHRGQGAQKLFAVGKGIGLFLSGKIIEGHNGRIWAESEGEGRGSTFCIELPVRQQILLNKPDNGNKILEHGKEI